MKVIENGVYKYFSESPKEEIDLTNSLFSNVNFENKDEVFSVTEKVLSLPINEQVHVIHCILDVMYILSSDSKTTENIEKFLAQDVFKNHRNLIIPVLDKDTEKIKEFETLLNIKISDYSDWFFSDEDNKWINYKETY